jgi:hypothetical protein
LGFPLHIKHIVIAPLSLGRLDLAQESLSIFFEGKAILGSIGGNVFAFYLLLWEFVFTCDLDFKGEDHA